jgi:hypothetical protein
MDLFSCGKDRARGSEKGRCVVAKNIYYDVDLQESDLTAEEREKVFDLVYTDWFVECSTKYGRVEELIFAGNTSENMVGDIWIWFAKEDSASKCMEGMLQTNYGGREVVLVRRELDVGSAVCRAQREKGCVNGRRCRDLHPIQPTRNTRKNLFADQERHHNKHGAWDRDENVCA